ncbi:MAG: hypothetical protein KGS44_11775, partial [Alphaproteobacteria bacterium]|nr:hypothetical protein [Alphaproteobacteria bacterium]
KALAHSAEHWAPLDPAVEDLHEGLRARLFFLIRPNRSLTPRLSLHFGARRAADFWLIDRAIKGSQGRQRRPLVRLHPSRRGVRKAR